jgi:heat shock protein HtpX
MSGPPVNGPWGDHNAAPPAAAVPAAAPSSPPITAQRVNSTDFVAAEAANRRKTWMLILFLIVLGFLVGYVLGWAAQAWGTDSNQFRLFAISGLGIFGGLIFSGVGVGAATVTLLAGDKVVLSMNGAKEVTAEQEPVLHNVVEEMAIAAGLPKPRVYVMETDALNAFATGLSQQKSAIAVTRGLLNTLNREQLQGVVAHEMGHVLNLDTRYMVTVGIMVGLIAVVSDIALRMTQFGGYRSGSRSSSRESKGGGGAAIVVFVIALVFMILAPIAAQMVRFAVSRQREYLADATSVQLTRNPVGLISALEVLGAGETKGPEIGNRATQALFIVNPLHQFSGNTPALFATHPSIEDRIHRLQNLGRV